MIGVFLRSALPDYHLSAESEETVESGTGAAPRSVYPFSVHIKQSAYDLAKPKDSRADPDLGLGVPMMYRSILATAFEQQVRRLGLTEATCAASTQLREWCERNRNQFYVPEWLLKRWGMHVNADTTVSLESQSLTRGRHTQVH